MRLQLVQVRDKVVEVQNKAVMNPAKFVKHTLTQGCLEYTFNLPDMPQIPNHEVLGFMKETANAGTKRENTYNVQHIHVQEIVLQFSDKKFQLQTKFMSGNVFRAYKQLYVDTGL